MNKDLLPDAIDHFALIKAARQNLNVLTQFLDSSPDAVNQVDDLSLMKKTLLHTVFEQCYPGTENLESFKPMISTLLSRRNIDLNIQDINGNTPLHHLFNHYGDHTALDNYHYFSFLTPLLKGHFIDTTLLNGDGYGILHLAAKQNTLSSSDFENHQPAYPTALMMLLSVLNQPNLNGLSKHGATPLAYSVKAQCIPDIWTLIQAGANPSVHENANYNVLKLLSDLYFLFQCHVIAELENESEAKNRYKAAATEIKLIINTINDAKPVQQHYKELLRRHERHLKKIIASNPSILTTPDEDGMTLYHHLADLADSKSINVATASLLFNQADVNLSLQDYAGNTPIHIVLERLGENQHPDDIAALTYPSFIVLMRRTGFDYSLVNKAKLSVYHLAAVITKKPKKYDPLSLLLEGSRYHATINAYDSRRKTALILACNNLVRQRRHIECFVNHGASADVVAYRDGALTANNPYKYVQNRIDMLTSLTAMKRTNFDFFLLMNYKPAGLGPQKRSLEKITRKIQQHQNLLIKMKYPALLQEKIAHKEITETAAVLSQGVREGHIFSTLPKKALIKFALFSTNAHYGSKAEAKRIATESFDHWLKIKSY